jgi:hypothetical protein
MELPPKTFQFALPLPQNPHMIVHGHLTFFKTNTMLFLTTAEAGELGGLTPMGSFVYAMPNVALTELTLYPYLMIQAT